MEGPTRSISAADGSASGDAALQAAPSSSSGREGYTVIARRYRPQSFEELIGQESAAQALRGAIAAGRVGHAYLFTGARGVGKTSAARIMAKCLNCEHGPTPTPCNQCDICQGISSGEDLDVLEIDGASNRGIDEIRELRQNVHVRPSRARFKIYIIDEVHMLTREAFNALLKTLEEPPEHVKFLFCTTEPEKIPITILSRCQRFDFAGIAPARISQRLRYIAETEGATVDEAALELLARRAAGSMRDSQSLLEQILSFGGKQITAADVHTLLGTVGGERLVRIVAAMARRQPAEALAELDAALGEGCDLGQLLGQLLGALRDVMVLKLGGQPESLVFSSVQEGRELFEQTRAVGLEAVLAAMQILDQTLARMRYSTHGRVLAEMALVQLCRLDDIEELPALVAEVRAGATASGPAQPASRVVPPAAAPALARPVPPAPASSAPAAPLEASKKNNSPALDEVNAELAAAEPVAVEPVGPCLELKSDNAAAAWRQVVTELGGLLAGHALQCDGVRATSDGLVVAFRESRRGSREYCEQSPQRGRIVERLAALTGRAARIEFETIADPVEEVPPSRARAPAVSRERSLRQRAEHPLAQRAIELFDAKPLAVEEPESG